MKDKTKSILFVPRNCIPFHGKTLQERALGGTESSVIRFAESLQSLGYDITVLSEFENPPLTKVLYVPYKSIQFFGVFDAIIFVRDWHSIFLPLQGKQKFFWTGDSYDQIASIGIGDKRIRDKIDYLLTVSNWQKDTLCSQSGFPSEKAYTLYNGVDLKLFDISSNQVLSKKNRIFYSSTPFRGLEHLPRLLSKIKEKFTDFEVRIYSGYDVYKGVEISTKQLEHYDALVKELNKIEGVQIIGNVKQKDLAIEMLESKILAYPNTFEETCCITALEAKASGCAIVTSCKGALPEVVGDKGGILIEGNPGEEAYDNLFVNSVIAYLSDDNLFKETSEFNIQDIQERFDWDRISKRFVNHFLSD